MASLGWERGTRSGKDRCPKAREGRPIIVGPYR